MGRIEEKAKETAKMLRGVKGSMEKFLWDFSAKCSWLGRYGNAHRVKYTDEVIKLISAKEKKTVVPEIMISVEGGVVSSIISTIPLKIRMVDYDNLKAGDPPDDEHTMGVPDSICTHEKLKELFNENVEIYK